MCTLQVVMTTLCRRCHSRPRVAGPFCARCELTRDPRDGSRPAVAVRPRSFSRCRPTPPAPTRAEPGSLEKVAVLAARVARGQALWHPLDPTQSAPRRRPRVVRVSELPRRDHRTDDTQLEELLSRGEE